MYVFLLSTSCSKFAVPANGFKSSISGCFTYLNYARGYSNNSSALYRINYTRRNEYNTTITESSKLFLFTNEFVRKIDVLLGSGTIKLNILTIITRVCSVQQ